MKNLANDGWYLYYDEYVGQLYVSNFVKVTDDGKLSCSKEIPPHGALGKAHSYLCVLGDTKKLLGVAAAMYLFLHGRFQSLLEQRKDLHCHF